MTTELPWVELDRAILEKLERLGDPTLVEEVVALCKTEMARCITQLDAALRDRDVSAVQGLSHSICGITASLGAFRVAESAASLERLASGASLVGADALRTVVTLRWGRACRALNQLTASSPRELQ